MSRGTQRSGSATRTIAGYVGAAWGVLGVSLLLAIAIYRLARLAASALDHPLDWQHWAGSVIFTAFMLYSEGYRGFQLSFSPMVAARARYLRANPRLTHVVLAPAFCMGYFHATRARRIKSTLLTIMIVIFVVLVQRIEQPWRGIVDAGVVAGLAWGLVTLVVFCHQALSRREFRYSPETPEIGQS